MGFFGRCAEAVGDIARTIVDDESDDVQLPLVDNSWRERHLVVVGVHLVGRHRSREAFHAAKTTEDATCQVVEVDVGCMFAFCFPSIELPIPAIRVVVGLFVSCYGVFCQDIGDMIVCLHVVSGEEF